MSVTNGFLDIDLGEALDRAFPHHACARCGNQSFVIRNAGQGSLRDQMRRHAERRASGRDTQNFEDMRDFVEKISPSLFVDVTCDRRGSTERFHAPTLLYAEKPIARSRPDG